MDQATDRDIDAKIKRFFFQAEDGIRDGRVPGVQTCALPICSKEESPQIRGAKVRSRCEQERRECDAPAQAWYAQERKERPWRQSKEPEASDRDRSLRSAEERREGTEETQLVAEAFLRPCLTSGRTAARRSVTAR